MAGGGWELPALWTMALLVRPGLGDVAYALGTGFARGKRAVAA